MQRPMNATSLQQQIDSLQQLVGSLQQALEDARRENTLLRQNLRPEAPFVAEIKIAPVNTQP